MLAGMRAVSTACLATLKADLGGSARGAAQQALNKRHYEHVITRAVQFSRGLGAQTCARLRRQQGRRCRREGAGGHVRDQRRMPGHAAGQGGRGGTRCGAGGARRAARHGGCGLHLYASWWVLHLQVIRVEGLNNRGEGLVSCTSLAL